MPDVRCQRSDATRPGGGVDRATIDSYVMRPTAVAVWTCTVLTLLSFNGKTVTAQSLDVAVAARFADLALSCVHQEYPNKIAHVLDGDEDVKPPRELTPAFYGCFDWHSAVHGHWLLARLARLYPDTDFAQAARAALGRNLTPANIAREVAYMGREGRTTFERPYGLAWLLQLAGELNEWNHPDASRWAAALAPLATTAADRIAEWLPKLTYPIRVGEHSQTAFAFGLILDWARTVEDDRIADLLGARIHDYYADDRACPLAYEPSGQDFLSPCLAEADLMRRVMTPTRFAEWLDQFLPSIPTNLDDALRWLTPAEVTDRSDGKLAHLDGLNLSRAWMLEGVTSGLPDGDARRPVLAIVAAHHRNAGLAAVTGEHYEGGHWLGSFATYLVTARGTSERH